MEIAKTDIVLSTAGHDSGRHSCVMSAEGEYLLLADGKTRTVEKPKRKKRKHTAYVGACPAWVAEQIRNEQTITNSMLRKTLAAYGRGGNPDQEEDTLGKIRYDRG